MSTYITNSFSVRYRTIPSPSNDSRIPILNTAPPLTIPILFPFQSHSLIPNANSNRAFFPSIRTRRKNPTPSSISQPLTKILIVYDKVKSHRPVRRVQPRHASTAAIFVPFRAFSDDDDPFRYAGRASGQQRDGRWAQSTWAGIR